MEATLAQALRWAHGELAGAGVPSPDTDAVLLAAHLMGLSRGEVEAKAILGASEPAGFRELVAQRAQRIPLQYLTGKAPFRQLELSVGPGVFVPRPETELLVQLSLDEARRWRETGVPHPRVMDLGTGSGAIALAIATEDPTTRVFAVEKEDSAFDWAQQNLRGSKVTLTQADYQDYEPENAGTFCVVVSNPPYVPPEDIPTEPEVRDYDPPTALYGGADHGMALPCAAMDTAVRLLRPGGALFMEHAESQVAAMERDLAARGFVEIQLHCDLAGKPRATGARRPDADEDSSIDPHQTLS
ncbi:peptide chain release factor N(5)-glutamine methyltransferase [Kocuria carniphila]|uniref:peptide chain release factor N(5)-glutamine methyltransferase n=1 Tax=Kocuria carniphila TaxID=262208 RepID=A0ABV3UZR4_9MICC